MPRFGITGHVNLTPDSDPLVYEAIADQLRPYAGVDLTGVSCMAPGADLIFATAVVDLGGRLEVVLPTDRYRAQVDDAYLGRYDRLLEYAGSVRVLPFRRANRTAFDAANQTLVNSTLDCLYAVWDGRSVGKKGSTSSVIAYARSVGVPVHVIWPDGVRRTATR